MSERRQMGIKDFLYIAAAIGGLGSLGWLIKIANAVQAGEEARVRVERLEPVVSDHGTQIAVLQSKMDYVVQTVGKIDRRMERRDR